MKFNNKFLITNVFNFNSVSQVIFFSEKSVIGTSEKTSTPWFYTNNFLHAEDFNFDDPLVFFL